MEILHVSAECYPVAKAGGLGDVVGALPKFQCALGHVAKVVMPMYKTKYLYSHDWQVVHKGGAHLGHRWFEFTVIKEKTNAQGFDLYLLDINGLLDREKVYGYEDDTERFSAFQIAVLSWINQWKDLPNIIHVHDHHTALIPFIMQHSFGFSRLSPIPTVLTIHNAQYQGAFGWGKVHYIPQWDSWKSGLLEWHGSINPLASGIKCAWKVTTVSHTYLNELRSSSNGLEALFEYEKGKCQGILNGIDHAVWDPGTDSYLSNHYTPANVESGKEQNKKMLCEKFDLDPNLPLIVFIGRLVGEKGAELLPDLINASFHHEGRKMNFLVLGSGEGAVEQHLSAIQPHFEGNFNVYIGYNETLSHVMYAGADFLIMPSRVEPCGLNQLYALRYGTIPIVRKTGGLKDTVVDVGESDGYGITFVQPTVQDALRAVQRALELYDQKKVFRNLQKKSMTLDFSWDRSAKAYINLYESFK